MSSAAPYSVVTVTTVAQSKDLVLLATVKDELGIAQATTTHDAKLNRLIATAGALFEGPNGLNRPPWRQTYQELAPGTGGERMLMSRWPIESIGSITLDDTTVTASTYSIAGTRRDRVYREDEWSYTAFPTTARKIGTAEGPELDYTSAYTAGWLMPGAAATPAVGKVADWNASTAYITEQWAKSTTPSAYLFECTTAGTSGASEPTWPTAEAGTVVDNTATWTARLAAELPFDLQEAALITVMDWFRGGLLTPSGIKSEAADGVRLEYWDPNNSSTSMGAPPFALQVARSWA